MSKLKATSREKKIKTRVTSKKFKIKNRAITRGIIEIIDLNNEEVELIANGYSRRQSQNDNKDLKIELLLGKDYKSKITKNN